ncbi:MAG: hypothetical protein ACM3SU_13760 [Acidobacteriota bacterium]
MPSMHEEPTLPSASAKLRRLLGHLWLAAALALLLFPAIGWKRIPAGYRLSLPVTPLDATRPATAEEWRFLDLARRFVPRGATFTVLARDKSREMELFMMSFGLLPEGVPLPASYFLLPEEIGDRAEYALAFGCDPRGSRGAALIGRVPLGCVYRRQRVGP